MKLTESEIQFIKETYTFYPDSRIVTELNRIRGGLGESFVTIDMVRKARYKLGIKKGGERGS